MKYFNRALMLATFFFIILAFGICIVKLTEINKVQTALENHEKMVTKEYWIQMPVKGRVGNSLVEFSMTHFESFNPLEQLKEVQFELGKYSYLHTADELQDTTIVAIINQLQNDNLHYIQITKINK